MHIAFLSNHDPENINAWSGIPYFVHHGLQHLGHESKIYNTHIPMKEAVLRSMAAYPYEPENSPWHYISPVTLKFTNQWVQEQLRQDPPDLILSQGAFWIAYLETSLPIVYWSDLPAHLLHSTYRERYQGTPPHILQTWEQLEAMAFLSANLIWYPSHWAQRYVIAHQGVSESQTVVLPFGANLSDPPTTAAVNTWITQRQSQITDTLRLFFAGKDWERKGGARLLELMRHLKQEQIDAALHIVGCEPSIPEDLAPLVHVHGFLDKKKPEHASLYHKLWKESHVFVMPSLAEGLGIVYCEAAAYGLPILACNVGGVSSVVDDRNGKCFPAQASAHDFTQWLLHLKNHPNRYGALCHTSRQRYEEELNWPVTLSKLEPFLKSLLLKG